MFIKPIIEPLSLFNKNLILMNRVFVRFKGKSSNIWLDRQRKDPYVKRAVKESYRARSAFKLIEIDEKFKFLNCGDIVIDIGSAPGSWTQVAIEKVNSNGKKINKPKGIVISVDRDYILPLDDAYILSYSDITEKETFLKISKILNGKKATHIISDMAPNSSGQSTFDHDAIIDLQKKALELAKQSLDSNGYFLCKIWFGDLTKQFCDELHNYFKFVKLIKPDSSRNDSAEIFIFCSNFFLNK